MLRAALRASFAGFSSVVSLTAPADARTAQLTPSQAEGPFYPVRVPTDHDGDLLVSGTGGHPAGSPLHLSGQVRNARGSPLTEVRVEIWQCDANGIYNHPAQPGVEHFDAAFQGFGAVDVDADARYQFLTIVPVPYPGRPPHIHVKLIRKGNTLLTTQLYLRGHPDNQRDWLLQRLLPSRRAALTLNLQPVALANGRSGHAANFDFVV